MPDFDTFNERLPDLEFVRQKELDGNLIHVNGSRAANSAGDIVAFTPATGKTFFLILSTIFSSNYESAKMQLKMDTNVRQFLDVLDIKFMHPLPQYGESVVGNASRKATVEISTAGLSTTLIHGHLMGWIENT